VISKFFNTSKTLWDGSILQNLGGKALILFQGK